MDDTEGLFEEGTEAQEIDTNMVNLASFLLQELRASSPYKTGNMKASISLVSVTSKYIDIIINVDYASYVNEQKKHYHWIEKVLSRTTRAFAQNNVEDESMFTGLDAEVIYGKGE